MVLVLLRVRQGLRWGRLVLSFLAVVFSAGLLLQPAS